MNRTMKPTADYSAPTVYMIGVSTTTPTSSDTTLGRQVPITGQETVDACDSGAWTDSADMTTSFNTTTFKLGTGALNLTKYAGASVNASASKTTTSVDFTSKRLELFLYILDSTTLNLLATTDCLTIRFGSDSTNYYQWTRDTSELAVGWNYISNMTSANADSTTGSPSLTAMDYTFVQLTTAAAGSTWAAGAVIMDDIRVGSSGDYTKTFTTGYPLFDETNMQSTVRTALLTTEANGQSLTEFGLFNTDSTSKMFSHLVHTSVAKTSNVQINYVEKDKWIVT